MEVHRRRPDDKCPQCPKTTKSFFLPLSPTLKDDSENTTENTNIEIEPETKAAILKGEATKTYKTHLSSTNHTILGGIQVSFFGGCNCKVNAYCSFKNDKCVSNQMFTNRVASTLFGYQCQNISRQVQLLLSNKLPS